MLCSTGSEVLPASKLLERGTCCQGQLILNAIGRLIPRLVKAAGMDVVRGWAVLGVQASDTVFQGTSILAPPLRYEHLDKGVSEAFVAERFWWNSLPVAASGHVARVRIVSFSSRAPRLRTAHG